jgi:hypothetical protein
MPLGLRALAAGIPPIIDEEAAERPDGSTIMF